MTEKTKLIIALRQDGKTYKEISIILGCTLKSVARVCENYGCTYKKTNKPEEEWQKDVRRLRSEGVDYKTISEHLGVSYYQVSSLCRLNGLTYSDLNQKRPYTITEKCIKSYKTRDVSHLHENKGPAEQTKQIIDLRKQGKNYDEIVVILGCKMKSVRYACQKYHFTYQDIENTWKNKVADLRRAGKTYAECAEILGVDKEKVERHCRYNGLGYSELGQKPPAPVGWIGEHFYGPNPNRGKTSIDWQKRIDDKTGGLFDVVFIELDDTGEAILTLRCRECGNVRSCKSISVRHSGNIICRSCIEFKNKKQKQEEELDRAFAKWKKEVQRGRSLKQPSLPFCKCGQLIPFGRSVCDICKESSRKAIQQRKDHMRRLREGVQADKDISLEKLYDRDHGICYLCNKSCDWSDFKKVNGVFIVGGSYPTVEHVVPLCKGGSHTWDNIKLACHSCNSKKGRK